MTDPDMTDPEPDYEALLAEDKAEADEDWEKAKDVLDQLGFGDFDFTQP